MLARLLRYLNRPEVRRDRARLVGRRLVFEAERLLAPSRLRRARTVRFDGDLRIRVDPSNIYGRSLYLYGAYEFHATQEFKRLIGSGSVVVDVGANIGVYTLLAAKCTGQTGKVVSFEPDPQSWSRLIENLAINELHHVTPLNVALANFAGQAPLALSPDPDNPGLASLRHRPGSSEGVVEVNCKRLDDVLAELEIPYVDVMKVDAEGVETEVFRGARETLQKSQPAVLFEVNGLTEADGYFTSSSMDELRTLGYQLFGIRVMGNSYRRELVELEAGQDPRPFTEQWHHLNLLALYPDAHGTGRGTRHYATTLLKPS